MLFVHISNCELNCCDISDVHNLIAVGSSLVSQILLYVAINFFIVQFIVFFINISVKRKKFTWESLESGMQEVGVVH